MTPAQYEQACSIIERVIERLDDEGRHFNGVMNSGFFATAEGVKVIEFNARFGDPECMNIMSLFEGSWTAGHGAASPLAGSAPADVQLRQEASVVLYLVSPDYALRARAAAYEFPLDRAAHRSERLRVFFASAVEVAHGALPHRRDLPGGRAGGHGADARAGARAGGARAPPPSRCSSGAATSATSATCGSERLVRPRPMAWRRARAGERRRGAAPEAG